MTRTWKEPLPFARLWGLSMQTKREIVVAEIRAGWPGTSDMKALLWAPGCLSWKYIPLASLGWRKTQPCSISFWSRCKQFVLRSDYNIISLHKLLKSKYNLQAQMYTNHKHPAWRIYPKVNTHLTTTHMEKLPAFQKPLSGPSQAPALPSPTGNLYNFDLMTSIFLYIWWPR